MALRVVGLKMAEPDAVGGATKLHRADVLALLHVANTLRFAEITELAADVVCSFDDQHIFAFDIEMNNALCMNVRQRARNLREALK